MRWGKRRGKGLILYFLSDAWGCNWPEIIKWRCRQQLTTHLRKDGWPALAIHGDKSQQERDWVLKEFKSGKQPVMVATDVAARGLGL